MTCQARRAPTHRTPASRRATSEDSAGAHAFSSRVDRAIARMVRRVVRRHSPEKVILFGSHATGNTGPDSDVDFLIVMNCRGTREDAELELRKTMRDFHIPKDVIVTTPEEFAWRKKVAGTIERPAAREGRILFEIR